MYEERVRMQRDQQPKKKLFHAIYLKLQSFNRFQFERLSSVVVCVQYGYTW